MSYVGAMGEIVGIKFTTFCAIAKSVYKQIIFYKYLLWAASKID